MVTEANVVSSFDDVDTHRRSREAVLALTGAVPRHQMMLLFHHLQAYSYASVRSRHHFSRLEMRLEVCLELSGAVWR